MKGDLFLAIHGELVWFCDEGSEVFEVAGEGLSTGENPLPIGTNGSVSIFHSDDSKDFFRLKAMRP